MSPIQKMPSCKKSNLFYLPLLTSQAIMDMRKNVFAPAFLLFFLFCSCSTAIPFPWVQSHHWRHWSIWILRSSLYALHSLSQSSWPSKDIRTLLSHWLWVVANEKLGNAVPLRHAHLHVRCWNSYYDRCWHLRWMPLHCTCSCCWAVKSRAIWLEMDRGWWGTVPTAPHAFLYMFITWSIFMGGQKRGMGDREWAWTPRQGQNGKFWRNLMEKK